VRAGGRRSGRATRTHQSPAGLFEVQDFAVRYLRAKWSARSVAACSSANDPICTAQRPPVPAEVGLCIKLDFHLGHARLNHVDLSCGGEVRRSTIRPGMKGPRSVMRTNAECPVLMLVTRTTEPSAEFGAPQSWRSCYRLRHLIPADLVGRSYQLASPVSVIRAGAGGTEGS